MIYVTRYVHNKSIKILRLNYDQLIGRIQEPEGKKYLMADDDMLGIVCYTRLKK